MVNHFLNIRRYHCLERGRVRSLGKLSLQQGLSPQFSSGVFSCGALPGKHDGRHFSNNASDPSSSSLPSSSSSSSSSTHQKRWRPEYTYVHLLAFRRLLRLAKWFDANKSFQPLLSKSFLLSEELRNKDYYDNIYRSCITGTGYYIPAALSHKYLPSLAPAPLNSDASSGITYSISKSIKRVCRDLALQEHLKEISALNILDGLFCGVRHFNRLYNFSINNISDVPLLTDIHSFPNVKHAEETPTPGSKTAFDSRLSSEKAADARRVVPSSQHPFLLVTPPPTVDSLNASRFGSSSIISQGSTVGTSYGNDRKTKEKLGKGKLGQRFVWDSQTEKERFERSIKLVTEKDFLNIKPGTILLAHPFSRDIWTRSVILVNRRSSRPATHIEGVVINKKPFYFPLENGTSHAVKDNNRLINYVSEILDAVIPTTAQQVWESSKRLQSDLLSLCLSYRSPNGNQTSVRKQYQISPLVPYKLCQMYVDDYNSRLAAKSTTATHPSIASHHPRSRRSIFKTPNLLSKRTPDLHTSSNPTSSSSPSSTSLIRTHLSSASHSPSPPSVFGSPRSHGIEGELRDIRLAIRALCRRTGWFGGPLPDVVLLHDDREAGRQTVIDGSVYYGMANNKVVELIRQHLDGSNKLNAPAPEVQVKESGANQGNNSTSNLEEPETGLLKPEGKEEVGSNKAAEKERRSGGDVYYSGDMEEEEEKKEKRVVAVGGGEDRSLKDSPSVRRIIGVSGWDAYQLRDELIRGYWIPIRIEDPVLIKSVVWGEGGPVIWEKLMSAVSEDFSFHSQLPSHFIDSFIEKESSSDSTSTLFLGSGTGREYVDDEIYFNYDDDYSTEGNSDSDSDGLEEGVGRGGEIERFDSNKSGHLGFWKSQLRSRLRDEEDEEELMDEQIDKENGSDDDKRN